TVPVPRLVERHQRGACPRGGAEEPEPAGGNRRQAWPADRARGPGGHAQGPRGGRRRAGHGGSGRGAAQMTGEGEVGGLKVTQIKSKIGGTQVQRDTLRSLGLKRI